MSEPHDIDGALIQWGDRLFYPGNRIVKTKPQPKLSALAACQNAAFDGQSSIGFAQEANDLLLAESLLHRSDPLLGLIEL